MVEHGLFHEDTCGQVTVSSGMDLAVGAIPAGAGIVNGTSLAAVSSSTVTIGAADATNPRRDIVYVTSAGAFGVTAGTAAADPAPPALAAGRLALAEVAVAANASSISSGNITDMRQTLPFGTPRFIQKANAETVNNSITVQADDELFFSIFPSERWLVEIILTFSAAPATPGFLCNFAMPAGSAGFYTSEFFSSSTMINANAPFSFSVGASSTGTAISWARIRGFVSSASTAGTITFQWAQAVATATNTTIQSANTWLVATRSA